MRPNVIILTLDAFRADRTSLLGYDRPTTPVLSRLAQNAVSCSRAHSLCAWTQPSLLTAFTSSRPFDYGGFDSGAVGRPRTIFDVLCRAGYQTHGISTTPWVTGFFGYRFDHETHHFSLNALFGCYVHLMSSYLERWRDGKASIGETAEKIEPIIRKMGRDIPGFTDSSYRFGGVYGVLSRALREFDADPESYIGRHLWAATTSHDWLGHAWRAKRTPSWLARELVLRLGDKIVGLFNPRLAKLRSYRHKRFIDGHDLADKVIATAKAAQEPFCIWAHFHDTHSPYLAGRGKHWYRQTPEYLRAVGYFLGPQQYGSDFGSFLCSPGNDPIAALEPPSDRWSPLYDAAVRYTDAQIGRVMDSLGTLKNRTVVVIAADHGEELGEHGDYGHHFRLYQHNVHVPMLFHAPWLPKITVNGLTTLMDLAPTIAEMCHVKPDPQWQGSVVSSFAVRDRDHVMMETTFGGTCDLSIRPAYFAVRTKKRKFLWCEAIDSTDRLTKQCQEYYHLQLDPREADEISQYMDVNWYRERIGARMNDIPEISAARVMEAA